jgi:two-component system response regulator (stage 0 sporulation protein A)
MTTVLYPLVAENYEVSSESVERSIRTAIQLAWDRGNPEAFSKYFGYNSQVRKKRPTNAEFIARISDEIRIKYNVS